MLTTEIPGRPSLSLAYAVLDVNGTVAVDGSVSEPVAARIRELARHLKVFLLTADTFGTAKDLARTLGVEAVVLEPGGREEEQKAEFVGSLGPGGCVAIGNGANDTSMLDAADLGIAVLGREGLCPELLTRADLVVTSVLRSVQRTGLFVEEGLGCPSKYGCVRRAKRMKEPHHKRPSCGLPGSCGTSTPGCRTRPWGLAFFGVNPMTSESSVYGPDAGKTPEQLLSERSKRLQDALQGRQPDRVPIALRLGNMLAELAGATRQELYENPERARAALVEAALRFQPDTISGLWGTPGPSRALGDRSTRWPGFGLEANASFQFVEQEYMKAEDYDAFIEDPSDWAVRVFLPRVFSELEGFATLPPLAMAAFGYYGVVFNSPAFASPEMERALRALVTAGQLQLEWLKEQRATTGALAAAGFPPGPIGGLLLEAPFDFMTDTLRGMKGIFFDMRRCPDKLLAAQERAARFQLQYALAAAARPNGSKAAFFPLHRGSDGFMSIPQFERFYWPQLKEMFLRLVEGGITPIVFYEGRWDERLHYLAELPKGKTVGYFQDTDLFRAKEVLGENMCIVGGMPVSMLIAATAKEVREHTRRLCELVGRGGGFIMTTEIGDLEGCKPDLVRAWVEATREFGGG